MWSQFLKFFQTLQLTVALEFKCRFSLSAISIKTIFAHLSNRLTSNRINTCDHIVVCIAALLPMQQICITKMMMLILSIIVMRSYLCSLCLVCRVLKSTYFKEHPWVIAFKHSICDTENNTYAFQLCSMFKLSPNGRDIIFSSSGI